MDRAELNLNLLCEILQLVFDDPKQVVSFYESKLARARSLPSKVRLNTQNMARRFIRWKNLVLPNRPDSISMQWVKNAVETIDEVQSKPIETFLPLSLDEWTRLLSFPKWMLSVWVDSYGAQTAVRLALSLNQEPLIALRVNQLKASTDQVMHALKQQNISAQDGTQEFAVILNQRINLKGFHAYKKGWFEIQDLGSQWLVEQCPVSEKMKVLDACARTGGKTLALAGKMHNQGELLALDVDARVFEEMDQRLKRAGVGIVKHRWIAKDDPDPLGKKMHEHFDCIVVDAPCSGLGVLKRMFAQKWIMSQNSIVHFDKTQLNILNRFSKYLKPSGTLTYMTCTLTKQENESVVEAFLQSHPNFKLVHLKTLMPFEFNSDGFFFALLEKTAA